MLEIHGNADAAARNLNMKTFLWITTASSSELYSCINNLFHQKLVQGIQLKKVRLTYILVNELLNLRK